MKPTMPKYCRTEREDKLLVVTLDRPDVLNSLNAPACFELEEIFNDFERDPTLWIAVITGAGDRAFCAGHDLADAPDAPMPPSGWAGLAERPKRSKPLIAAVNGLAMGGGFEIALACDIVIADSRSIFAMSEPRVGAVAPPAAGVARWGCIICILIICLLKYRVTRNPEAGAKSPRRVRLTVRLPERLYEHYVSRSRC